ncbi:MAG TPA: hypothetical protein VIW67_15880 [Terriglobales bacterium]|jgi:hypothetical protein
MKILSFIAWWATLPMLALLIGLMVWHRSVRYFPWFFTYVLYTVLVAIARFLFRNHEIYPYIYWYSDAGAAVLGIIVMYEVFRSVTHKLIRHWLVRAIFPVTVICTLILTFLRTRAVNTDLNTSMSWAVGGEMCARIIEVAMFLLLLVFVAVLGVRWREHQFGISAGFGIYAACALLASTKYYEIGSKFNLWFSVISLVSYTVAVLIWLWYFSTPVAVEVPSSDEPPLSLQDLERYKDIARRVPRA